MCRTWGPSFLPPFKIGGSSISHGYLTERFIGSFLKFVSPPCFCQRYHKLVFLALSIVDQTSLAILLGNWSIWWKKGQFARSWIFRVQLLWQRPQNAFLISRRPSRCNLISVLLEILMASFSCLSPLIVLHLPALTRGVIWRLLSYYGARQLARQSDNYTLTHFPNTLFSARRKEYPKNQKRPSKMSWVIFHTYIWLAGRQKIQMQEDQIQGAAHTHWVRGRQSGQCTSACLRGGWVGRWVGGWLLSLLWYSVHGNWHCNTLKLKLNVKCFWRVTQGSPSFFTLHWVSWHFTNILQTALPLTHLVLETSSRCKTLFLKNFCQFHKMSSHKTFL